MATAGAEFMALETTEEAGTCLAFRSMLGLVGSSVRGVGNVKGGVGAGDDPAGTPQPFWHMVGLHCLGWGTRSHPQQSQDVPGTLHRSPIPCPNPPLGSLPCRLQ